TRGGGLENLKARAGTEVGPNIWAGWGWLRTRRPQRLRGPDHWRRPPEPPVRCTIFATAGKAPKRNPGCESCKTNNDKDLSKRRRGTAGAISCVIKGQGTR